jgi:hypothetical protein
MRKNMVTVGLTLGVAATVGLGVGAAGATGATGTPPTLAAIQSKAAAAITLRVNDLNAGVTKVNGLGAIGSGAPALVAYLQKDIPELQALGQKIAGDTTVAEAEADARTIFTNYRVLALVLPAARQAGASDEIMYGVDPRVAAGVARATKLETPANEGTVGPLLTDLQAQVTAASSATSGVAATVLSYTPAQWNANHSLLSPITASVSSARSDMQKAKSDVQQIRAALKPAAAAGAGAGAGA